jgi:streptogramin lyase
VTRHRGSRITIAAVGAALATLSIAPASATAATTRLAGKAFPVQGTPSGELTAGPDGNVWLAGQVEGPQRMEHGTVQAGDISGFVAKVTPRGAVTEYNVSSGLHSAGSVAFVAKGPDGNVWFTGAISWPLNGSVILHEGNTVRVRLHDGTVTAPGEPEGLNIIGKVTPAGAVTEYTVGTSLPVAVPGGAAVSSGLDAGDIAAGPDGNLWFTGGRAGDGGAVIGRITPSGQVSEYTAGLSGGGAYITAGPDGNMWFTGAGLGQGAGGGLIGKITPGGSITEFPLPPGLAPGDITAGPGRKLWFGASHNRIGSITAAGAITVYNVLPSTAVEDLARITSAPDGNLWVTEPLAGRIARVTPAGKVTQYRVTPGDAGITASAGRNLWITYRIPGTIQRVPIPKEAAKHSAKRHTSRHK